MQAITAYLSLPDIASLILCNHALLSILGTSSWGTLRSSPDKNDLTVFLRRLAGDLPRHFFCCYCIRLHLVASVTLPGPAWAPARPLRSCREQLEPPHDQGKPSSLSHSFRVHGRTSWYNFRFNHLALAMKRHYCGPPHGIATEELSFVEVQNSTKLTSLLSVEAQICVDWAVPSLILQLQNWALPRNNNLTPDEFLMQVEFIIDICFHSLFDKDLEQHLKALLQNPSNPKPILTNPGIPSSVHTAKLNSILEPSSADKNVQHLSSPDGWTSGQVWTQVVCSSMRTSKMICPNQAWALFRAGEISGTRSRMRADRRWILLPNEMGSTWLETATRWNWTFSMIGIGFCRVENENDCPGGGCT